MLFLAFDVGRWCDARDGSARIDLRLTAEARLEKEPTGVRPSSAPHRSSPLQGSACGSESSRGDPSGWTVRPTRADVAQPASSPYTRTRRRWSSPKPPLLADGSCGPPSRRDQEHAMPHRTTESPRWRRARIGFVIRSQVTNLWRDLRFTLHQLTQSAAGSAGMSSRRALTRRLVPVPAIDRRGHQVPARYASHRAGIDRWQCSGVGHIDLPSQGQPLSPPRRSSAGGPSTEGHSCG